MIKLKHSKFKNTGFIYEILVRNISIDILLNKLSTPSYNILKKFFKYGTQLNLLLLLYNILLTNKMKTSLQAQMLIKLVLSLYNKLDKYALNKLKYKLILYIKLYYNLLDLFSTKVLLYKTLASIYKLFLSRNSKLNYNPVLIVNSKQIVILHITNVSTILLLKDLIVLNFINQDEDTQTLAYKLIILRFNKKYKTIFTLLQKVLLRKYMYSFSNVGMLKLHINLIVPIMINKILLNIKKLDNSVIKIKLLLVLHQINNIQYNRLIKLNHVIALLKTYSLLELLLVI